MSGKSGGYHRVSGLRSPVVAGSGGGSGTTTINNITNTTIVGDVLDYSITASAGSNVSTTLTHNLGDANYIVQVVDANGDNIVFPFTRTNNDITFYFGEVAVDTDYTVLISGASLSLIHISEPTRRS